MQEHGSRTADASETESILATTSIAHMPEESSSSVEITVNEDSSIAVPDVSSLRHPEEGVALINTELAQCRICFDAEGEDLIAPCHCRGTQKYVHRSCLDNWRSTKEGFAFAHCTECRAKFILRANVPHDRWWLRLKFQFLVARDHAVIFVVVQLVVAFLGMLVYKFYGEELREMFGYAEHPYGFYIMASEFRFICFRTSLYVFFIFV
ncbi:hypothetical protein M569_11097, partial [Genlisea aurea]